MDEASTKQMRPWWSPRSYMEQAAVFLSPTFLVKSVSMRMRVSKHDPVSCRSIASATNPWMARESGSAVNVATAPLARGKPNVFLAITKYAYTAKLRKPNLNLSNLLVVFTSKTTDTTRPLRATTADILGISGKPFAVSTTNAYYPPRFAWHLSISCIC